MSDVPGGPEVVGEAAPAGEQIDAPVEDEIVEPQRQYVEIDDPDNRWDRVKVDGEDVEVTVAEMRRGYSREADYTRKAQALARQREEAEFGIRLQQAYQANPQATIRFLAEQAGMDFGQQQAPPPEEPTYMDPLEREIASERQARLALEQRIEQREMDERVDRQVASLRQQFNATDEDIQAVISVAMRSNYPVEALPMIYKSMTLDRLQARAQAAQAAKAAQDAENTRRQAAKAQASQTVSAGGNGAGNNLTNRTQLQDRPTFRQAALAAFEELEGRP